MSAADTASASLAEELPSLDRRRLKSAPPAPVMSASVADVAERLSSSCSSCGAGGACSVAAGGFDAAESAGGAAEAAFCSSASGMPRATRMSLTTTLVLGDEPVDAIGI